jgi:hypothetical protein
MLGGLAADEGGVCAAPATRATAPPCVATNSATVASALPSRFMTAPFSARFNERATFIRQIAPCPATLARRSQDE